MKKLIAILLLVSSPFVVTQELHTFSNGEVADAEKINQNFQYVLENATGSGGCSAEQDGSSVVITCADGTSGVLAGEGTVVVYDGGEVGEPDIIEYPTGAVVIVDDNDIVLGEAWVDYIISFDTPWPRVELANNDESLTVQYGPYLNQKLYFLNEDCTEGPFGASSDQSIYLLDSDFYWKVPAAEQTDLLVASYKVSAGASNNENPVQSDCIMKEQVANNVVPLAKYTMPARVVNAQYPVRLKQLP